MLSESGGVIVLSSFFFHEVSEFRGWCAHDCWSGQHFGAPVRRVSLSCRRSLGTAVVAGKICAIGGHLMSRSSSDALILHPEGIMSTIVSCLPDARLFLVPVKCDCFSATGKCVFRTVVRVSCFSLSCLRRR